ncbi:MAG: Maf family protein [Monoglobus pectinilyticus]|uniref:Maf family protein n=1 Tax=Monoglobus pectinilyticus TaxID=1981510 RepID=UPI00399AFE45
MRFILASASPRRREILENISLDFEIIADESEEIMIEGEKPYDTVKRLAMQKAKNIAAGIESGENTIVIGADTVVSIDGNILGKPNDEIEAKDMLLTLSGRINTVYTGLAVIETQSGKEVSDFVSTGVKFRNLSEKEIENYIRSGEPMDKAGAYGIQKIGGLFVESINGDYFNVVGLPLCRLGEILSEEFGINLI